MKITGIQKNVADQAREVSYCLKGLAHETRLAILVSLQAGEQNVTSLVQAIGCSQSTLSQHLAIMRAGRLVKTRRHGNQIYYSASDRRLFQILELLRATFVQERVGEANRTAATPAPSVTLPPA